MQRVRWWRVGLILFALLLSVIYILPSVPSFYGSMLGHLPRNMQGEGGVTKPVAVDDGIEFNLDAFSAKSTEDLQRGYRSLATILRSRARTLGLTDVQINGASTPTEDATNIRSTVKMTYTDPQSRPSQTLINQMQLFGKLPMGVRGWLVPEQRIQLGLDLKGGVYLVLELDLDEAQAQLKNELQTSVQTDLRERFRVNARDVRVDGDALILSIKPNTDWGKPGDTKKQDTEDYLEGKENLRHTALNNGAPNADGLIEYRLVIDPGSMTEQQEQALTQVLEVLRNRIDAFGVSEPDIRREPNRPRIIVQLPGASDSSTAANVVKTMGRLEFRMVKRQDNRTWFGVANPPAIEEIPPDADLLFSREGNWYVVEKQVVVTGGDLVRAAPQAYFADIVVGIKFDANGRRRFGQATSDHRGENLAIVLDDTVVSAPSIDEPILGGEAIIRGGFTQEEAADLSRVLRAGAFPVGVKIAEERTVGPSLGREAINNGAKAAALGLLLVLLFMVFFYRVGGLFASFALMMNALMILAALALLGATLTLPGLAGLVLTIGMAVDANVLINERIKEELRTGKTVNSAINAGYGRVFWTIFDANLTTILTAIVLIQFGTGPIRGFGVTLTIGICTSMFTSMFVTREFFRLFEGRGAKSLPIYPLFGFRQAVASDRKG
ncbi:MAG: protein translocase subunit SecD [Candidatus Poribacteria bacterium]|nr:protein translocase subunit SecD [Candidatus Poribacteria bacterium]